MANWLYDKHGNATLIVDFGCIRSNHGQVLAWINFIHVYNLNGNHIGWFEKGILYDFNNDVLGFTKSRSGHLLSTPGISEINATTSFAGKPEKPEYGSIPGRPGVGGWTYKDLSTYLNGK